jgi:hypothetical protein
VRDSAEGPDALAGADVVAADVAWDILLRRRRGAGLKGRTDHDHILHDDGRRAGADGAGLHGGAVQAFEEIDEAVLAKGWDGLSRFGIEGNQLVTGGNDDDAVVAFAIAPIRKATIVLPRHH